MNMEIKARALRIILIVLAFAILFVRPNMLGVDVDMLMLFLMAGALVLPPALQWRFSVRTMDVFDILQAAVQILGPAMIFAAAAADGPHGAWVPLAAIFYGIMLIGEKMSDMAAIICELRRSPS